MAARLSFDGVLIVPPAGDYRFESCPVHFGSRDEGFLQCRDNLFTVSVADGRALLKLQATICGQPIHDIQFVDARVWPICCYFYREW